jgi:hypothetical protein
MPPSGTTQSPLPPHVYEPPKLTELGTLHEVTLSKLRESTDGFSFTGPRIVKTSP